MADSYGLFTGVADVATQNVGDVATALMNTAGNDAVVTTALLGGGAYYYKKRKQA